MPPTAKPRKPEPKVTRLRLSDTDHRLVRIAAGIAGITIAAYCGRAAVAQAKKDTADLSLPK